MKALAGIDLARGFPIILMIKHPRVTRSTLESTNGLLYRLEYSLQVPQVRTKVQVNALIIAVNRLDKSFSRSPVDVHRLSKLHAHKFTLKDGATIYILHTLSALFSLPSHCLCLNPYSTARTLVTSSRTSPIQFSSSSLDSLFNLQSDPLRFLPSSAALIWFFCPPVLRLFANAFGHQNCFGVFTQILLSCAAPWLHTASHPQHTARQGPRAA
ncbi:hypothetical protein BDR05DRAFT_634741 [Suillus weaverae]|nr:hypothetical protein BDR05DRAFT_634741 [Suillus weaverae]